MEPTSTLPSSNNILVITRQVFTQKSQKIESLSFHFFSYSLLNAWSPHVVARRGVHLQACTHKLLIVRRGIIGSQYKMNLYVINMNRDILVVIILTVKIWKNHNRQIREGAYHLSSSSYNNIN